MFDPTQLPPSPRPPAIRPFILTALLAMLVAAFGAHWVTNEYRRGQVSRGMLSRSYERRIVIADMMSQLKDAESGWRHYRIQRDPDYLAAYRSATASIEGQEKRLERLLVGVPMQSARYERLQAIIGAQMEAMEGGLNDAAANRRAVGGEPPEAGLDRARSVAEAMMAEEDRMIDARSRRWDARGADAQRNVWWLVALLFVLVSTGLALVLHGLKARYRMAITVQEAAARLGGVFAGTNDAIALLDADGRIEAVNPAVTRLLGYSPDKLIGRDISMLVDVLPSRGTLPERIGLTGGVIAEPVRIDRNAYHADGHVVPVDVALGLMPMPAGLHVVAAIRDISERKAIDRMKDEFIATASHELRTPLTSVVGALGLLRTISGTTLPDAARRLVTVAEENSRRLIHLINDLLDIEKMGSGELRLRTMPIDLVPILWRAVQGSEGLAAGRGIAITLWAPDGMVPVRGNDGELERVVTNLLANAIRFSPDGGVVTLTSERRDGRAIVTVDDRGPGVPPAFREQLFARFAQSADVRATGGTGLGLAISRQIIDAHGGTIWFEPRPGGGARFRFSIDLRMVEDAPPRLMLVGDRPGRIPELQQIAWRGGCVVDRIATIAEATAEADARGCDAILIDPGAGDPALPDALAGRMAADAPVWLLVLLDDGTIRIADGPLRAAWRTIDAGDGALAAALRANAPPQHADVDR